MPNHQQLLATAEHIEIVIFSSKTLGADSLLSQGFDWLVTPFSLSDLSHLLSKVKIIEDRWGDRIRRWQKEGCVDEGQEIITPGVIAWKVKIDLSKDGRKPFDFLRPIASLLADYPPMISLAFPDEGFNAEASANKIINELRDVPPFLY